MEKDTMVPTNPKLVLDVNQAGAALSASPWTIRKWIAEGKLERIKFGRKVGIEPEALARFVKEAKRNTPKVKPKE